MLNRYWLIAIALLSWMLFGILILVPGTYFILSYSLIQNAIGVGACFGAMIGLIVGVTAVSPAISIHNVSAFRWVLFGSMIGAVITTMSLLWIGDFPKGTQADLSLLLLVPTSLAVGAVLGMLCADLLWRFRQSR